MNLKCMVSKLVFIKMSTLFLFLGIVNSSFASDCGEPRLHKLLKQLESERVHGRGYLVIHKLEKLPDSILSYLPQCAINELITFVRDYDGLSTAADETLKILLSQKVVNESVLEFLNSILKNENGTGNFGHYSGVILTTFSYIMNYSGDMKKFEDSLIERMVRDDSYDFLAIEALSKSKNLSVTSIVTVFNLLEMRFYHEKFTFFAIKALRNQISDFSPRWHLKIKRIYSNVATYERYLNLEWLYEMQAEMLNDLNQIRIEKELDLFSFERLSEFCQDTKAEFKIDELEKKYNERCEELSTEDLMD